MIADGFIYESRPARVIFGAGTLARLPDELARLKCKRALVLSTPEQAAMAGAVSALIGPAAGAVFTGAAMHTPVAVTERAMAIVAAEAIDATIAIGGGSTTGLGKAIALRTDLPQIVVPTTYAGSEMTPILGETAAGAKKTVRDPKVLPETVIYDVDLTLSLPAGLSATSGLNAIAHAVEGLYARDGNPVMALIAEEGIRALGLALPAIAAAPRDRQARTHALYGAWLCGTVLGNTAMALHHKLCHVLGGSFDLPHAETHAVVLPHAVAYNAAAAPKAMARIERALQVGTAAGGLYDLARAIGAPSALRDIGMPRDGLDRAAEIASADPYANPRPIDRAGLRALLEAAWSGERPR